MPTSATTTYTVNKLDPVYDSEDARSTHVNLAASVTYPSGQVLGEQVGTNSIQTVAITGGGTGGTFTLTFSSQTTAGIAYNASAKTVENALWALSTVGNGNVAVRGGPAGVSPLIIEFVGTLAAAAQTAITCSIASVTGGTPAQAVTQTQTGAAGTPGTYAKYVATNTDGSQVAKKILTYACITDSSGNITLGTATGGGDYQQTVKSVEAYNSGTFLASDITGLDTKALSDLSGHLISGVLGSTTAVVRFG